MIQIGYDHSEASQMKKNLFDKTPLVNDIEHWLDKASHFKTYTRAQVTLPQGASIGSLSERDEVRDWVHIRNKARRDACIKMIDLGRQTVFSHYNTLFP